MHKSLIILFGFLGDWRVLYDYSLFIRYSCTCIQLAEGCSVRVVRLWTCTTVSVCARRDTLTARTLGDVTVRPLTRIIGVRRPQRGGGGFWGSAPSPFPLWIGIFFFFLLVREVGNVRCILLLRVWKIDPKILRPKKGDGDSFPPPPPPPLIGFFRPGAASWHACNINPTPHPLKKNPGTLVGVRDQFRLGVLRSVARIFSPLLARKSSGFARIIHYFCPKMAIWKILGGLQPPAPRLVRLWVQDKNYNTAILMGLLRFIVTLTCWKKEQGREEGGNVERTSPKQNKK